MPGFVRSFRIDCLKSAIIDFITKALKQLSLTLFLRSFKIFISFSTLKRSLKRLFNAFQEIGGKFVEPPTFDIAKSYGDSLNTTPLIFILSPGTDPVSDVIRFAEQRLGLKEAS